MSPTIPQQYSIPSLEAVQPNPDLAPAPRPELTGVFVNPGLTSDTDSVLASDLAAALGPELRGVLVVPSLDFCIFPNPAPAQRPELRGVLAFCLIPDLAPVTPPD